MTRVAPTAQNTSLAACRHAIARIAACSYDDLLLLDAPRARALIESLDAADAELQRASELLLKQLYAAVPLASDAARRRVLINAQRQVHRQCTLEAAVIEQLRPMADAYASACVRVEALTGEAEEVFAEELEATRDSFRELLRQDVMQDALALSSGRLLESINRFYLQRRELNGKDLDTEIGAMKYFSRAAAKTSPFSKFTAFAPMALAEIDEPLAVRGGASIEAHVRLNVGLLSVLRQVLARPGELRALLPLRLNRTLSSDADRHRFLTNRANVESFQEIGAHPGVDLIVEALQVPSRWRDVRGSIIAAFECETADADALIEKMLSHGLVEVDLPVSGSDPDWDVALIAALREIAAGNAFADQLCAALADSRALAETFARARGEERLEICRAMFGRWKELVGDDFPAKTEAMVFEDATLALSVEVRREDAEELMRITDRFAGVVSSFDLDLEQIEGVREFYATHYPAGSEVPLLTLYEDFYRAEKARGEEPRNCIATAERLAEQRECIARLAERLKERAARDCVSLSAEELEACGFRDRGGARKSLAAYMQCYVENGRLLGVLNAPGPGFGKLSSRFLHLLPPAMTDEMREWHERGKPALFAEVNDAAHFNANLHPPLMPYEIVIPGGQTSLPPSRQISVTDLVVACDDDGALRLLHRPTRRTVFVMDCCLQRVTSRSKLYQLLMHFSLAGQPSPHAIPLAVGRAAAEHDGDAGVRVRPRIVFEERLVLQRRTWIVPRAELPLRARGESAFAYFRRVNAWRARWNIPRQVFATKVERQRKEDKKPQFISFDSPLLIAVFEKLIAPAQQGVHLSEMLPAAEHLDRIEGRRHVTEFLFQWYRA